MSKKTKETRKAVEAKSAATGKIKKRKPKKDNKNDSTDGSESTIVSKTSVLAENIKKIMETTNNTHSTEDNKRKQKDSDATTTKKNENFNKKNKRKENKGTDHRGGKNNDKNQNKKQKKNSDDTNKGKNGEDNNKKDSSNNNNGDGADNDEAKWSKSKKKRMRALKTKQLKQQQHEQAEASNTTKSDKKGGGDTVTDSNNASATPTRGSKLQNAFKARLSGSRFRILNEELYTKDSNESFAHFSKNPELFEQYHEGFRHQVASWPVNPVDVIVRWIVNRYGTQMKNSPSKKKKKKSNNKATVADFGCGDAQLAKDLIQRHPDAFQVYSFDLVSQDPELVTACDMANVPLEAKSVDVVVFCLALMGTNLADFIREAHRVLKDNGRVQIAEVRSRIEYSHGRSNKKGDSKNNNGNDDNDSSLSGTLDEFVQILSQLGFECAKTDRSNKMFLFLELKKNGKAPNKKLEFSAKPCIYKRR